LFSRDTGQVKGPRILDSSFTPHGTLGAPFKFTCSTGSRDSHKAEVSRVAKAPWGHGIMINGDWSKSPGLLIPSPESVLFCGPNCPRSKSLLFYRGRLNLHNVTSHLLFLDIQSAHLDLQWPAISSPPFNGARRPMAGVALFVYSPPLSCVIGHHCPPLLLLPDSCQLPLSNSDLSSSNSLPGILLPPLFRSTWTLFTS
jgi:hypothetical protein